MDKYIRLNTVLQPPPEVQRYTIELSQKISNQHKSFFVLDGINYHPHLTLYSPEYPSSNFKKVFGAIEGVCKNTNPIKSSPVRIEAHQGYIGIEMEATDEIKELHENILKSLNPLREGHLREKYVQALNSLEHNFSDEQIKNIKLYGYPEVVDTFRPHLTIIRIEDETAADEFVKNFSLDLKLFVTNTIGVYTTAPYGICNKLVEEFRLG